MSPASQSFRFRESRRVLREAAIRLTVPGGDGELSGWTRDIATGGLFVSTPTPMPVGAAVHFVLQLGSDDEPADVEGEATVVWVRPEAGGADQPAGMGLQFHRVVPPGEERLALLFSERQGDGDFIPPAPSRVAAGAGMQEADAFGAEDAAETVRGDDQARAVEPAEPAGLIEPVEPAEERLATPVRPADSVETVGSVELVQAEVTDPVGPADSVELVEAEVPDPVGTAGLAETKSADRVEPVERVHAEAADRVDPAGLVEVETAAPVEPVGLVEVEAAERVEAKAAPSEESVEPQLEPPAAEFPPIDRPLAAEGAAGAGEVEATHAELFGQLADDGDEDWMKPDSRSRPWLWPAVGGAVLLVALIVFRGPLINLFGPGGAPAEEGASAEVPGFETSTPRPGAETPPEGAGESSTTSPLPVSLDEQAADSAVTADTEAAGAAAASASESAEPVALERTAPDPPTVAVERTEPAPSAVAVEQPAPTGLIAGGEPASDRADCGGRATLAIPSDCRGRATFVRATGCGGGGPVRRPPRAGRPCGHRDPLHRHRLTRRPLCVRSPPRRQVTGR